MALVICPSCGPLNYSGRIIFRICDSCKVGASVLRKSERVRVV